MCLNRLSVAREAQSRFCNEIMNRRQATRQMHPHSSPASAADQFSGTHKSEQPDAAHISDEPQTLKTLTDRLLDIGGTPDFTVSQPRIEHTLRSIPEADLQTQEAGLPILNHAVDTLAAQRLRLPLLSPRVPP